MYTLITITNEIQWESVYFSKKCQKDYQNQIKSFSGI